MPTDLRYLGLLHTIENYEEELCGSELCPSFQLWAISMLAASTTVVAAATGIPGTSATAAQAPVNLGTAGTFAILTKSGVTDVYASAINGNVGASPITGAAIGLECPEVMTGTIYSVDAAGPACKVTDATLLTTAVGDMETAYTDAAGRTFPDFIDLGAGEIGGLTLLPGLYKWNTGVSISTDVTLSGGPNDVWIFQIAGTIDQASAKNVTLTGGAQAKNVFWQSAGAVTIGTTAHFEGTILAKTMIAMKTHASDEWQTAGTDGSHASDEHGHTARSVRSPGAPRSGPRRRW